ncbi:hypothetical protein E2C01_028114 [Portunus trituberculatus]|uniref:Uncharacterized protein n=1 Tax=Portunus trituberculatus TaxID=210409 RepID=A0A5B7EMS2_PORTR|nr:hypothetical protein [Portunus trituberculatus]
MVFVTHSSSYQPSFDLIQLPKSQTYHAKDNTTTITTITTTITTTTTTTTTATATFTLSIQPPMDAS